MFWYDRYKPIFECAINLVVSIILAKKYGVAGIFIGTIISTVTVSLWVEPFILYKHAFEKSILDYFGRLLKYTLSGVLSLFIMLYVCSYIETVTILTFIIKGIICVVIFNICFLVCFVRTEECKYLNNIIKQFFNKYISKIRKEKVKGKHFI